jgi:hypothetical protein
VYIKAAASLVSVTCLAAAILLASLAHAQSIGRNPPSSPGEVFLFSGLVWPIFDSTAGSGSEVLMQRIEASGVRAELNEPTQWETAVKDFLPAGKQSIPIAVVGYSLGTKAALLFTSRLESEGVPVQTLVLIEASNPQPIMSNVRRAVHFYVSALSDPIQPGTGFTGSLANIDLAKIDPTAATLNHWSVSHFDKLHNAILAEILVANHVRVRGKRDQSNPSPAIAVQKQVIEPSAVRTRKVDSFVQTR